MSGKCPKCGFEYGEFDIYCSRCGEKLNQAHNQNESLDEATNDMLRSFYTENNNETIENQINLEFVKRANDEKVSIYDIFAILFIIAMAVSLLLFIILNKQTKTKAYLEYKNLITKPALIPVLKGGNTIDEFSQNLSSNEHFLKLYLKYSNDDTDKKEQIFNSYINEISKVSNLTNDDIEVESHPECSAISVPSVASKCLKIYNKSLKHTGVKAYLYGINIYFYPNIKYISSNYGKYLSNDLKYYLKLQAKYSNPVSFDNVLQVKPNVLGNKIYEFEDYYLNTDNQQIKDKIEETLYKDVRSFIFARDIYATTSQEMKKEYKSAYKNYIKKYNKSSFVSLFMSYLNTQRAYGDENFKNDYPYRIFENTFDKNVENNVFKDIFAQLRKNIAAKYENSNFAYIYNILNGKWTKFQNGINLEQNVYVISQPDQDNNITIYTSAFSPMQELNIQKYASLYLINGNLYIYNKDKLSFSKLNFNGKLFSTKTMNFSDVTAIFPGLDVINLDSTTGYHIYIEKPNKVGRYILSSRYLQGFNDYELTVLKGSIDANTSLGIINVATDDEVIISFHSKNVDPNETSDQTPTYKIHISTIGKPKTREELTQDELKNDSTADTSDEDIEKPHQPNIKPKINTNNSNALVLPPSQTLEPPSDDD